MNSIEQCARDLASGKVTSRQLTEACFARIKDPEGEGPRAFIRLFEAQALAAADASDKLRAAGVPMPVLAGVPISVKDLFDIAGVTTLAGSVALKDRPPAARDAPAIARLRAAGAIIVGTTNMTEFAMGGLGMNPHYGTPLNPYDRAHRRIPGGSSSGAAVSVTDGMAVAAIGSDTAGSVRMPAALCGIVGFKPTARRVPLEGVIPLAQSLDSVGGLASTVACCALLDAVLAGEDPVVPGEIPVEGLRFAVPKTLVFDDVEPAVAAAFSRAILRLSKAGARIIDVELAELAEIPNLNKAGSLPVMEGYAWHHDLLANKKEQYDPIIAKRFLAGAGNSVYDYIQLQNGRAELIRRFAAATAAFDAVLMPTVPLVAPTIESLEKEEAWLATNRLIIRNAGVGNFLDCCSISLPCHKAGEPPVGFKMMAQAMADKRLLGMARGVEVVLGGPRRGAGAAQRDRRQPE